VLADLDWHAEGDKYVVVDELGTTSPGVVLRRVHARAQARGTYVHASDDDLKQGSQALAKIHRVG
jgi:hypothetical protein